MTFSLKEKIVYLAGFLDGDGSIYVRAKPSSEYRYGFQIAPYIVFFQSEKTKVEFLKIFKNLNLGYLRIRKDGILEYIIGREENIRKFITLLKPFLVLKKRQANLMERILNQKSKVKNRKDFQKLMDLIEEFRTLNYSKKRKFHILTP